MYIKCNNGITYESLKVKLLVTRMFIMSIISYRINYKTVKLHRLTGIFSQLTNTHENKLFATSGLILLFPPQC